MKPRIPRHFRNLCIPEMQIDLRSVCNLMSRVKENVPPADSRPVTASNVQKSVNGSQRRSVAGARAELRYHAKKTAMLGHYCFEPGPAMNPHMLCDELQCDFTLRNECTSVVSFCACHPSCSGHEYHVDSYEHCCKCFVLLGHMSVAVLATQSTVISPPMHFRHRILSKEILFEKNMHPPSTLCHITHLSTEIIIPGCYCR